MPRFEYRRMTAQELSQFLTRYGMTARTLARIFGTRPETLRKWLKGDADIPPWVFVATGLMERPGGLSEARQLAAEHIIRDNLRPEAGEFPYLANDDAITEDDGHGDD